LIDSVEGGKVTDSALKSGKHIDYINIVILLYRHQTLLSSIRQWGLGHKVQLWNWPGNILKSDRALKSKWMLPTVQLKDTPRSGFCTFLHIASPFPMCSYDCVTSCCCLLDLCNILYALAVFTALEPESWKRPIVGCNQNREACQEQCGNAFMDLVIFALNLTSLTLGVRHRLALEIKFSNNTFVPVWRRIRIPPP
jgi:hypothetical protein